MLLEYLNNTCKYCPHVDISSVCCRAGAAWGEVDKTAVRRHDTSPAWPSPAQPSPAQSSTGRGETFLVTAGDGDHRWRALPGLGNTPPRTSGHGGS